MKELELKAVNALMSIYQKYAEKNYSKELSNNTRQIYDEYHPGFILLSPIVNNAVGKLFPLAYPNSGSGIKRPSKKEIQEIIRELKKRKEEL